MALNHVTIVGFPKVLVLGTSITIPVKMLYAADNISRIKRQGQHHDEVSIRTPSSTKVYEIIAVHYNKPGWAA